MEPLPVHLNVDFLTLGIFFNGIATLATTSVSAATATTANGIATPATETITTTTAATTTTTSSSRCGDSIKE